MRTSHTAMAIVMTLAAARTSVLASTECGATSCPRPRASVPSTMTAGQVRESSLSRRPDRSAQTAAMRLRPSMNGSRKSPRPGPLPDRPSMPTKIVMHVTPSVPMKRNPRAWGLPAGCSAASASGRVKQAIANPPRKTNHVAASAHATAPATTGSRLR